MFRKKHSIFLQTRPRDAGFQILTTAILKTSIFWDITQCGSLKFYANFLFCPFFDLEDGSCMFLETS
jgi:hypothetical protein